MSGVKVFDGTGQNLSTESLQRKIAELEAIAKELWETLDEALEILQRASREAYPARLHDVRDKYRERFEK